MNWNECDQHYFEILFKPIDSEIQLDNKVCQIHSANHKGTHLPFQTCVVFIIKMLCSSISFSPISLDMHCLCVLSLLYEVLGMGHGKYKFYKMLQDRKDENENSLMHGNLPEVLCKYHSAYRNFSCMSDITSHICIS